MGTKSYEEIVAELKEVPTTFLPALIFELVKLSYERKVWLPGGASIAIKRMEVRKGLNK